jgi:uncharacterized phage protein (TIGR01671 family)
MSREIRFRAWDKVNPQMINHIRCLDFAAQKIVSEYDLGISEGQNSGCYHRKMSDVILMQFTGVKDKNGNEIYEGDIIRKVPKEWVSNSNPNISLEDYLISIANIGLVEYSNCEFILTNRNYQDRIYDGYGHGSIEVIGNIYETKELLTQ